MKGILTVITGCMYGRKSLELIETIKAWEFSETPYLAFSPIKEEIFSRASTYKIPAVHVAREHGGMISYLVGIEQKEGNSIKAVAIDEVSFYDTGIVGSVTQLLDNGIDVVVAGLDKDFRNEPFGSIGTLMALAERVEKRYTVCMKCKSALATTTQRLLEDGTTPAPYLSPLIVVDGEKKYKYQCRCKDCHERG